MSVLLILAITFAGLAEGVFIKKYNSKHMVGGFLFTSLISLFSMMVFVLTDKNGFCFPSLIWLYGMIAGVLYCGASFLTYMALESGSFGISMLILSYSLIFPIGYGLFFLNETATIFTYIGIILVMSSLYFTCDTKDGHKNFFSIKWMICIILSVIGSGMFSVVTRMQQIVFNNLYDNEFMIVSLGFSALILFVAGIIKDGKKIKYILRYGAPWAFGAGSCNGTVNTLTLLLYTMMPISIAVPIQAGARVIVSFVLSIILFSEKFSVKQWIGAVLGAVALVLLNIKF